LTFISRTLTIDAEGIKKEVISMKTVQISLNSIDKVKSFVNDITKFDYDFDLVSGRYVIDAKSIMGIFSLDLSKPIDLNVHAEGNVDEVLAVLKPYMI
jgi:phosphocarrier protein HPr